MNTKDLIDKNFVSYKDLQENIKIGEFCYCSTLIEVNK